MKTVRIAGRGDNKFVRTIKAHSIAIGYALSPIPASNPDDKGRKKTKNPINRKRIHPEPILTLVLFDKDGTFIRKLAFAARKYTIWMGPMASPEFL
jgi:hypothetical protein